MSEVSWLAETKFCRIFLPGNPQSLNIGTIDRAWFRLRSIEPAFHMSYLIWKAHASCSLIVLVVGRRMRGWSPTILFLPLFSSFTPNNSLQPPSSSSSFFFFFVFFFLNRKIKKKRYMTRLQAYCKRTKNILEDSASTLGVVGGTGLAGGRWRRSKTIWIVDGWKA